MTRGKITSIVFFLAISSYCLGQTVVPILSYDENTYGQVELEIEAQADKYYLLNTLHEPNPSFETITSITMGVDGNMLISEPGAAYLQQNYKVTEHSIADPDDTDGDGIDDVTEFNDMPTNGPLNYAEAINFVDGATVINDFDTFEALSVVEDVPWAPFLNGQQFVKFGILDLNSDNPKVYFINSATHFIHANFFSAIGANVVGDDGSGEIVFNPNEILPNGAFGSYSFNFSFGDAKNFETTQKTYELLLANMPYLKNNLQHFIGDGGELVYNDQYRDDYIGSRINVVLESDVFADIDFIPFNQAEGYGYFRHMQLDENPGSRDIVLYDALPNSLPRVGGIITSVIQTPLSHVNLRAIQDNVPNAYIKEPLLIDSIANLIGKYVYYAVDGDSYEIKEATLDEVNDWYENLRPTEDQIPERDLSITSIRPLDSIEFEMATAFGAKCSNVATMRSFGFPDGTIPDGFGIPFYFYDEFMKFNGFYDDVAVMIADVDFINDLETRIQMLKDFRQDIKDATMPQWMLDELQAMHDMFPEGQPVRCRSSTNNEDLPGFSGAGLYTSKTQYPEEGHISKSVKQVYASMWNFRAFDERDFYRVDHFIAAMGILCHPNYQEEKSNGVGVSLDPIYSTENTFYLNTQVGEALITNPNANEIPEEILLNEDPAEGYFVLRYSNLVPNDELVMSEEYLDLMRDYLREIHDRFEVLYNVVGAEGFGMDIEYKVTAEDQMIIKQARPWVSFWANIKAEYDLAVTEITDPVSSSALTDQQLITAKITNSGLRNMQDYEISLFLDDQMIETIEISDELNPQSFLEHQFTIPLEMGTIGDYDIAVTVAHPQDGFATNDTLETVISKLHLLEGGLTIEETIVKCGEEIEVIAKVINYGESIFVETEVEINVNGMVIDTFLYDFSIPYLAEVDFNITITENLQATDNVITLNLIRVNGSADDVLDNNSATSMVDLDSEYSYVTLVINADNYPEETSWQLYDETSNTVVGAGSMSEDDLILTQDICVDYNSCFTLSVFDSFGDGICCAYGDGNFLVMNDEGQTILTNDGSFGSMAQEFFCPGDDCLIAADFTVEDASNSNSTDGSITINASNGVAPYQYSIDGGVTFFSSNVFSNLGADSYMVAVKDSDENCFFEETVIVDMITGVNDISSQNIKLYPNPTEGNFVIEVDDNFNLSESLIIEIYNNLGKLIQTKSITSSGNSKSEISLNAYTSGSYIIKCYNQNFERNFQVIKI